MYHSGIEFEFWFGVGIGSDTGFGLGYFFDIVVSFFPTVTVH